MATKEKVIKKFNSRLGSDLKCLENFRSFHEELETEKNFIEESVSFKILLQINKCRFKNDLTLYQNVLLCRGILNFPKSIYIYKQTEFITLSVHFF